MKKYTPFNPLTVQYFSGFDLSLKMSMNYLSRYLKGWRELEFISEYYYLLKDYIASSSLFEMHHIYQNNDYLRDITNQTQGGTGMNANTLAENLWHQILTLPDNDRHWLRDKLNIYEKEREDEENLTPYTMEELHERIRCSEEDFEAGRFYSSEEIHRIIQKEIASL